MAGADKVNIPLRKLLQHDFFWILWFGGLGEHSPSQNIISRPQSTIQLIFYHSQQIRLQIIFYATNELEYRFMSSACLFFT